jgi:poly(A) polymerase
LALPLVGDLSVVDLIDQRGGLDDLQKCSLRMIGKDSLANDPLRIIKGVRHATQLGLKIESGTRQTMRSEVSGLERVAPERTRQEIWKILADQQAVNGLRLLQECGVGEQLFGAGFNGSLQVLVEKLEVCRDLWRQLAQDNTAVGAWLAEEVEQGLSGETLLLWTLLLTSINPELPSLLAEKWRLSRKARANIAAVVGLDKVALNDFATIARNERAYSWWAARYRIDPKLLLLALKVVGLPDSRSALQEIQAWVPLVARLNDRRMVDLVDGHWLRKELSIEEGPEMTKALELLRNAEISGAVANVTEAKDFLSRYYQNKD